MSRRIGLFGGTFNPVHVGHLMVAAATRRRFRLDKIWLIPSAVPPHKRVVDMASAEDRLMMVKLACRGRAGLAANPMEVQAGGPSYSILTLERMRILEPKAVLFFILGVDAFSEIETWRDYRTVVSRCHFVVVSRPGFDWETCRKKLAAVVDDRLLELRPDGPPLERLPRRPSIFFFPLPTPDISSTDIRRLVRNGQSPAGLVPAAVARYIRDRRLYQGGQ